MAALLYLGYVTPPAAIFCSVSGFKLSDVNRTDDGLKQSNYNAEIFKKHTLQEKMEQIKIAQSKGGNYSERYGNSPQHVKCHFKEGQSL